tara:strand:- start:1836 stop:3206 length:1371 start_codon:yes stop_codon:yes gene_type:complete
MLNNKQRRELLTRANEAEFPGSILDVFRGAEQGRDLIGEFTMSQGDPMAMASTPEEQNRGLRPFHDAGRTDMSMTFTDVPPNTPFNTVGMKKPIDIKTYDRQGHLVKSYDAVPPGMTGMSSGPNSAFAVERPTKAQSSVSPINYLLDTLNQPDPVRYAGEQTMQASDALRAETERVADVRANVLTQAQNIEQGQADLTDEARESYRFYQDTSRDLRGETPQAVRAELMRRQQMLPDSVKEVLPAEGRYNVFNVSPEMYTTSRQLYCTPYGCLPYQKAGASDLPIVHSNPKFRAGARSGSLPFQSIPASERQPGDIALQVGMAPADYGQSSGSYVLRPHHTTIYSGEAEGTTDFNDPESVMAYNARGGVAMRFGESEIDREEAPLEFYRYVGQTPQMQQTLEARQMVSRAMPLPTVEPLGIKPIPTSRPAQQLQARTTSPEVLTAARRRRRPRFRRV